MWHWFEVKERKRNFYGYNENTLEHKVYLKCLHMKRFLNFPYKEAELIAWFGMTCTLWIYLLLSPLIITGILIGMLGQRVALQMKLKADAERTYAEAQKLLKELRDEKGGYKRDELRERSPYDHKNYGYPRRVV